MWVRIIYLGYGFVHRLNNKSSFDIEILMPSSQSFKLNVLASTLLFFTGITLPTVAQAKAQAKPLYKPATVSTVSVVALNAEDEIQRTVVEMVDAEIQHWDPMQKAAFEEIQRMNLKEDELEALAQMSVGEMSTQLKAEGKLAKLSATGISAEETLKLIPAALLSRYLFNIGRAALWGGVVASIRSADFDYGAMSRALTRGNTRQFMTLLGDGMSGQGRFVRMVGTAATFACGSATLDFTPGLCDRFANGMVKIFNRVERSEGRTLNRRNVRSFYKAVD